MKIRTVWPGGEVEILYPSPAGLPYQIVTTGKTPEDVEPKRKSMPEWMGEYLGKLTTG